MRLLPLPLLPLLPLRLLRNNKDAIAQIARQFAKTMEDSIPKDVQKNVFRAQYTAAVSARFLFFLTNGVVASRGGSRADVDGVGVASAVAKILLEENNIDTKPFEDTIRPMVRAADANLTTAGNSPEKESEGMTEEAARDVSAFLEAHMSAILSVFREEMELIENEEYKFPYDMNPVTAPSYQTNLLQVLRISRDNIRDQQQKVQPRRQRKDGGQDLLSTFEIDEKRYPKYYAQNFHYQTDGWLSNESARLYDFQVETLFLGSADAMRRRCLPHLNKYLKSQKKNAKLLDVATGTGRFLTFVRDNNPELECTAQDLSPFYLAKTRDNHKAFDKNGGKLTLLEANAEDMSTLEDGSFDAVTCVYLFHELPPEAQKNVVKEMSRVLKPGGKLFFVDSAQRGDGKRMNMEKEIDQALENFPVFSHEPYYRAYSELDLKNLFKEVGGLDCEAEELAWVSKTLVFQKPGGDESSAMNGASVTELRDDDEDVDESVLAAANELKAEMRNSTVAPVVEEMEQKPAVEEITWAGEASTKEIFEQVTPEVIEEKEDEQN
jgi:ubiquinone/menaquinone biosynthesis C-methylase UbiE